MAGKPAGVGTAREGGRGTARRVTGCLPTLTCRCTAQDVTGDTTLTGRGSAPYDTRPGIYGTGTLNGYYTTWHMARY